MSSCSRSGKMKSPYTHRCVTCKAFKDSELKYFARLLGQKTTGSRTEVCNRVRGLVNPSKFDEVVNSLDNKRRRSLKARRRSLERLHGGEAIAKVPRAKQQPGLFDYIANGFTTPSASLSLSSSPKKAGLDFRPVSPNASFDVEDVILEEVDENAGGGTLFDYVAVAQNAPARRVKSDKKQANAPLKVAQRKKVPKDAAKQNKVVAQTDSEYPGDDQAIRDFIRAYASKKYSSSAVRKASMTQDLRNRRDVVPKTDYRKWKAEPWKYDLQGIDDGLSEKDEAMFHKRHFEAWGEDQ